jgi:drug/metabolite transporter (DMT)-like permease
MQSQKRLKRKTWFFLALMVLFNSAGDTLLSRGMKQVGAVRFSSPAILWHLLLRILSTASIWLGIASLLVFFVCYLLLLSWADFSFVMPATATVFVVVPLLGAVLLQEQVSATRWAGVLIICLGVALVSRTPASSTRAATHACSATPRAPLSPAGATASETR